MSEQGRCSFCNKPVNPDQDYRKVTGWEKHRSQGGTNAIRLRKTHEEWACFTCISKQARGIAVGQTALL
jgi:hypothetical protein